MSLGRNIRIQSNDNRDLIFCIGKDDDKKIDEDDDKEYINSVGWWFNGGLPNIIHLHELYLLNTSFSILIRRGAASLVKFNSS